MFVLPTLHDNDIRNSDTRLVDAEQKKTSGSRVALVVMDVGQGSPPKRPLQKRGSQTTDSLLMKFPF
jgi:hypothetical protein